LFPAVAAVALSSCGRDGRIPVHPVRGQILFDGRPTPNAKVGDDGSYTLTTFAGKDGAPEGEYKVTVQWLASTAPRTAREGDNYPVVNRLPSRYGDPRATPLTARISRGDNEIPAFRLGR
jgi:hypothetical protein